MLDTPPGLGGYFCSDSVTASWWAEVCGRALLLLGRKEDAAHQQRLDWLGCWAGWVQATPGEFQVRSCLAGTRS